MAQSGYTPILIYASSTPGALPSAANLTSSASGAELAINYADGKLYFKNSSGVVTLLAGSSSGPAGGSNTQVQYNSSGVLAGSSNMTFDGTSLTLGGNPTLSAGTANGVLYLNGSKVATSGSALTFDGTTFTVGASASARMSFDTSLLTVTRPINYQFRAAYDASNYMDVGYFGTNTVAPSNPFQTWNLNSSEGMRLTSTGLGIGTSSPSVRLQLEQAANSAPVTLLRLNNSGTTGGGPGIASRISFTAGATALGYVQGSNFASGAAGLQFSGDGTNAQATLDSSGNLGLGVTPSAWGSNFRSAIQGPYGNYALYADQSNYARFGLASNAFHNGTAFTYVNSSPAAQYQQFDGVHRWFTAPSGTAGNAITFTQAMTLDSSGNLGIGTSSPAYKLDVNGLIRSAGDAANFLLLEKSANTGVYARWKRPNREYYLALDINNNGGNDFSLYDATAGATRWTVDSSGNLGLGVTPSAWISTFKAIQVGNGASFQGQTNSVSIVHVSGNAYVDSGGTYRYIGTGEAAQRYQQYLGAHSWYTAASGTAGNAITFTQAMTLDASGRLLVGPTSAASVGNANFAVTGGAVYDGNFSLIAQLTDNTTSAGKGVLLGFNNSTNTGIISAAYGNGSESLAFWTHNNTSWGERARITSGGDLLVGDTTTSSSSGPGFKVTSPVAGHWDPAVVTSANNASYSCWDLYSTGAGAYRFYVTTTGVINATSNTITAISDQRLKENIQDIDVGLDKIMALKPRKFDWKEGKGKDKKGDRGWIAQEFEQVFPDMITTWKDEPPEGEEPYKAVNADLIPVLVKAIQEQQALITSLTARVALLEGN